MSSAPKAWAEASKTMLSWGETGWAGRVLDPDSPVCWIGKNLHFALSPRICLWVSPHGVGAA